MNKHYLLLNLLLLTIISGSAQSSIHLSLLPNEQWWGGAVQYAQKMPFNANSNYAFNLYGDISNNQSAPLLLSSKGRWVWCDEPFKFTFNLIHYRLVPNLAKPFNKEQQAIV